MTTLAQAVVGSHRTTSRVVVRDPSTGDEVELYVQSGSVTVDRTRDIRRTVSATLTDPTGELTPAAADDLLSPFGNELHVHRGVRLVDGTDDTVALGVFRLTDFAVSDGPDGLTIRLSGSDRSVAVQRAKWETTYVIASGTATEDAIADLLTDRYPDVTVNLPTMGATTPRVVLDGSDGDPWRDATDLARAAGWELYFDGAGEAVASLPATPDNDPVVVYEDGSEAVLLDLERQVSTASSVYNGVIATAESTDLPAPLRSVAWDDDPGSPTYYLGKFGKVPRLWSTPLATTQGQLDAAAQSMLDGLLGANEDVAFRQIVNPALDVNQVVEVTRPRSALDGVRVVLDVLEIPLAAADPMSASGRRRFL